MKRKIHKIYDIILKIIMAAYAYEFLKLIGEERQIKKVLKTEFVTKKGRNLYLDFLCMLEDDTLLNIEFQFKPTTSNDLNRFFNYNILSQTTYDSLCETVVVSFRTQKLGVKQIKIGKTKSTHPDFKYLGDINFKKTLNNIRNKIKNNSKLDNIDEILLMLMCLVPKNHNKAEILTEICRMLKKEHLFDLEKIDTFKAVMSLEIENLITREEREKLKGKIQMTPEAQEIMSKAISEVGRKYEYLEKQDLINKGKKEGIKEGKKEGKKEASESIAKNLKNILPDEEISKHTGLDLKTIRQL